MGDERVTECIPVALSNDSHDVLFYFLRNEALAQSDAIGQTLHMRVDHNSLLTERMRKDDVGSLASDARESREKIHLGSHRASPLLTEFEGCGNNRLRLVVEEAGRLDDLFDSKNIGVTQSTWDRQQTDVG